MTGTQSTLLWIYAAIVAIWPIRFVVLPGHPPPPAVPGRAVAAVPRGRSAAGHGDPAGQG